MKKMNERTARLYEAVKDAGLIDEAGGQSDLAKLLNVSSQVVNNWEKRGISKDGALDAQSRTDVNATWVLEGRGPMFIQQAHGSASASVAAVSTWPFARIRESDVRALDAAEVGRLEGIIATGIQQLQIPLKVAPPAQPARGSVHRDDAGLAFPMEPLVLPAAQRGTVAPATDPDLPFPDQPRELNPWEVRIPGRRAAPAGTPGTSLLSNAEDVVANVVIGDHASNDEFEPVAELADVRLAASPEGIEALNEASTGQLHFRKSFLRAHGADNGRGRVVYASGRSMEPVIPDGAAMLLVPAKGLSLRDVGAGGVWAIQFDGKMLVKTVTKPPGGMWVARSLNAEFPDILLETDVPVSIVGQIVWVGAELAPDMRGQWVRR